ncbi:hypothetical protein RI129_006162 [Pyrocoelia pectoralis]|uniref:Protein Star n=1 Tax=Pyrocoelia pectoralis TaxID=417401 RepID=A0AAN7VC03_9COLE
MCLNVYGYVILTILLQAYTKNNVNMNLPTNRNGIITPTTTTSQNLSSAQPPPPPTKMRQILPTISSLKNFLPALTFLVAFATVMTVLVIHMNNTATRHHQFLVNMSRDNEFLGVAQDNPDLITYIREVHLSPAIEPHHKPLESLGPFPTEDTAYIIKLLNNKKEGTFVEAGAYSDGRVSKTEYLEKRLSWHGLLIQPEPTHYFKLKRHNRGRSQAIHACLSSTPYPKEITFHQEDHDGVKINQIHTNTIDDPDWFNTRVKCFPFYSLLLAMNISSVDLFILESGGTELQVLQTIPFDKVSIDVINVQIQANDSEKDTIKKFLTSKNYTFMQNFNNIYVFRLKHSKV